jgi:hypothetical protein
MLIILTGLAVLCGFMETDADYKENLSFKGTAMSFKPYASAFYFVIHRYLTYDFKHCYGTNHLFRACTDTQDSMLYNIPSMKSRLANIATKIFLHS